MADWPLRAARCRTPCWRRALHGQWVNVQCGGIQALRAKVTGHKDLRMLMRYYHPRAADLAKKLG